MLWDYDTVGTNNLYEGFFYVNQLNLSEFNGLPAAGVWVLEVHDDVIGNAGTLESITLAINYELSSDPEPTPTPNEGHSKLNTLPSTASLSLLSTP